MTVTSSGRRLLSGTRTDQEDVNDSRRRLRAPRRSPAIDRPQVRFGINRRRGDGSGANLRVSDSKRPHVLRGGPDLLLEHSAARVTHTRRIVMFRMMVPLAAAACLLAVHTPTLSAAQSKPASRTTTAKPAAGKVVNINTASVAELNGLPGIGAKTAALIVEYRQKNGPFKKIEELMNVRGVGEKNFLKLKDQVSVGNAKADHDQPSQR
jgi:comEA protein